MDQAVKTLTEKFFSKHSYLHLDKKTLLLDPNSEPQGLYYLKSGNIRQFTVSAKGQELTAHIFEPGAFFPLHWALNNKKNQAFFEALTDAELYVAPKEKVLDFLRANPEVLMTTLARMVSAITGLSRRIEAQTFGSAYDRVISSLLYLAGHFGKKIGQEIIIKRHFTHEDVAKLTGITRERTSLQMEKLSRKKLVVSQPDHSLVIPNLSLLEQELQG